MGLSRRSQCQQFIQAYADILDRWNFKIPRVELLGNLTAHPRHNDFTFGDGALGMEQPKLM